ncbi:MAG: hypothetical protein TECD_01069 [Hyphomicrobiaceae bacterium hypho_1]
MLKPFKLFFPGKIICRFFIVSAIFIGIALFCQRTCMAQVKLNEVPLEALLESDELSELSVGDPNAPVTIVEYMSMSCAACAKFHKTTYQKLKKKYIDTGKVRFIIREFPLDNLAAAGAMLARCVNDNNKTLALISILLERQREWVSKQALQVLRKISIQAGLSKDSFEKCLQDKILLGKLSRRREKADKEFGIDATPSFFINGKRLRSQTFILSEFEKVIDPLL